MVNPIKAAPPPRYPTEVRSSLGMVNFCARFIPNLATLAQPLRDLTKNNVKWQWTETEQASFTSIKEQLSSKTVMAYYEPTSYTEVIVDPSPVGLGAMLVQLRQQSTYAC